MAEIDSDGALRLTGLPTQASGLRLALEADGLPGTNVGGYDLVDAEEFVLSEGEERDLGTLQFGTGVSVGGHVVDEAGEPVEGVVVRVRIEGVTERTTTDPGGAWTIDAIRPGSATVWVAHDDWAIHYWPGADRPAERIKVSDDGDVVDDVRLELLPEATLSGVISGLPEGLGDLELRAVNDDESVQIKVEVDTEGAFTAHRLAAGEWSLLVMGEGLGGVEDALRDADGHPRTWRVETGEHVDVGELPWVAEGVLEGRVSDSDGQPIQGAEVTAWPDAADLPQVSATTDDHGRYRLVGLVEGPYRVVAGFEAVCVDDPDHVDAWWPEARVQAQAHVLHPVAGQLVDGIDLALPQDLDHDGMDDAWELGRGLDPTRDDGGEDPDGDGYTNLEEYQLGTDPMAMSEDTALGGCGSPWSLSLVLMPLIGLVPCRRRS